MYVYCGSRLHVFQLFEHMTYCMDQNSEREYQDNSEAVSNVSSSASYGKNSNSHVQRHADDYVAQFYVAKFDFAYVDTPLLVVIWILFTATAKIGQKTTLC